MVVARMAAHRPDPALVDNLCLDQWDDKRAATGSHSSVGMAIGADYPEACNFAPVVRMVAEHQSSHHPVGGVVAAAVTVMAAYQTNFAARVACQKWVVRLDAALVVQQLTMRQARQRWFDHYLRQN